MAFSTIGFGICLIPDFVAASALQNGSLVRVLLRYRLHRRDVFAVYSPRRYPDPKLKTWIEHLRKGIPSLMKARSVIADNPEFWVGRSDNQKRKNANDADFNVSQHLRS